MARYWQHKETGNCCAVVENTVGLSYRYTEITKQQYDLHEGAKNTEQQVQADSEGELKDCGYCCPSCGRSYGPMVREENLIEGQGGGN